MRRSFLWALALSACDPFGLGSPASLAPSDASTEGATDAGNDAADGGAAPTPVLFYRSDTGEVGIADFASSGSIEVKKRAKLAVGLTHLTPLASDRLFTYDAKTGARTVSTVDTASGTFTTVVDDVSPGWTAFAALGTGRLLSYRADTGTLRVDEIVGTKIGKVGEFAGSDELQRHDVLVATRAGPFLLFSRGFTRSWIGGWASSASAPTGVAHADIAPTWTHVTAVAKTHVFFYVSEGASTGDAAFTQIDAAGADLDFLYWNADRPLPIGRESWSHVVGGPRTLLFYRSSDGAARTAAIATDEDLRFVFLELTPSPKPALGTGWTHIVSML